MYKENVVVLILWITAVYFVSAKFLIYAVVYMWILTAVVLNKNIVNMLNRNN